MYRSSGNLCPRCGVPLVQAGVALGCEGCSGVWIAVEHVRDMASQMQIPPEPVDLPRTSDQRQALVCPTCTEPMEPVISLGLAIDICKRQHGVWFDANELGALLLRAAKPPSL